MKVGSCCLKTLILGATKPRRNGPIGSEPPWVLAPFQGSPVHKVRKCQIFVVAGEQLVLATERDRADHFSAMLSSLERAVIDVTRERSPAA